MEISINALLEKADDFLTERAVRAWRRAMGTAPDNPQVALFSTAPELCRAEAFLATKERVESPRTDDARRARLKLFLAFLGRTAAEARAAQATDAVDELLRAKTLEAAGKTWALGEALREAPRQATREARDQLEAAAAAALWDEQSPFARRADAVIHTAAELRFSSATAFADFLNGREAGPRADDAAALLSGTADAYRDLLGYALKRLDAQLKPGVARLHDVERAVQAPWLHELFRREDLQHAVTRTLGDLGLHPNAHGRIALDTEARPGRAGGAQRFDVEVPDDVRLVLEPSMGFDAYAGWLGAWGAGQHRALVARTLPFVERALGDAAVVGATARLFESFLLDPGWLARYLRLTAAQGKEAARLFAFRQLFELRRSAATLSLERELLERGPVRPLADEYAARASDALGVTVPKGRFLHDVGTLLDSAPRLDAWALETTLHAHLLERFNEDYWRNPATGRWLSDHASRGQRDDAATVAASYGAKALSVVPAGRRRVAVMGA